jgi:hypothetical protein
MKTRFTNLTKNLKKLHQLPLVWCMCVFGSFVKCSRVWAIAGKKINKSIIFLINFNYFIPSCTSAGSVLQMYKVS